jgi:hypothetical protein
MEQFDTAMVVLKFAAAALFCAPFLLLIAPITIRPGHPGAVKRL